MYMYTAQSTDIQRKESGSALVVTMIVLAILTVLGLAGLDVADVNILISANDRDSKNSFFHADAGANVGHEFLEVAIDGVNATFYGSDATTWQNASISNFNSTDFPLSMYISGSIGTYVRSGRLNSAALEGSAMQIGSGYEGVGKGAPHGGFFINYLVRSHREGQRNSQSEVDLGWRHITY